MEQDEQKIREKIRAAEAAPVAWNKQQVWQAIERKPAAKTRMLVFYYAAASVVLAAALIFFSMERTQQRALAVQLAQLELAIAKESNQPLIVYRQEEVPGEIECPEEIPVVKKTESKKPNSNLPKKQKIREEKIHIASSEAEPIIIVIPEPVIEVAQESSPTPTVQRVAAIIGSVNNTMNPDPSADKRLGVRIQFTGNESTPADREPLKLLSKH